MEVFWEWMLEASLLAGMILVIRKIFMGKIRYRLIYALWGVVLLRFLIPVNMIATPFSIENLLSKASLVWEEEDLVQEEDYKNRQGILLEETGRGVFLSEGSDKKVSGKQNKIVSIGSEGKDSFYERGETVMVPAAGENSEKTLSMPWRRFLPVLWAVIFGLLFLWLFLYNIILLRKMKKNRILYGKRENVKIYAVSGIQNPCLYGFFHPSIYLPYSLILEDMEDKISKEELDQMITHEFVHYRHKDHIWAMFRMLLVSVYWFNPFVWIAASCSKKDAELFCDETVIRLLGEEKRFCYGEMLVRLAGKPVWGDFRYSMLQMSRKGKEMEQRIRAISGRRSYSKWMMIPLMAALCMAIGITCSAGMDSVAEQEQNAAKENADTRKQNTVSDKTENMTQKNSSALKNSSVWKDNTEISRYPYASLTWLEKALQEAGFNSGTLSQNSQKRAVNEGENSVSDSQSQWADTPEEAFDWYIKIFTSAVNTGNISKMDQVLAESREIYLQQCNLVKNYYKRGIREKVKGYSVSVREGENGCIEIDSKEKIKVSYADGKSKIVKQSYRYICEQDIDGNDGWIITDMQEIQP